MSYYNATASNGQPLPPWPGMFSGSIPLSLGRLDEQVFEINAQKGYNNGLSGFFGANGHLDWERMNSAADYQRLFEACPPLSSVISQKATAFANGLFETVNPNTRNYLRGKYKDWDNLWDEPTPMHTRSQWLSQIYIYLAMMGWVYVMPVYASGFEGREPSTLHILAPWDIEIEPIKRNIYTMVKGDPLRRIWLTGTDGTRKELNESKLILFTDNTCPLDPETRLPVGRMKQLSAPISLLLGNYESELSIVKERGAGGIISNAAGNDAAGQRPMVQGEKEEIQRQYARGYGILRGQSKVIITSAAINYTKMGLNIAEMQLHEGKVSAIKDINDKFVFPMALSAHTEHSAEANVTSAYESLYTNAIIPEAKAFVEQLNKGLDSKVKGVEFIVSYDHVSHLQKSEKEKGEGLLAEANAQEKLWELGLVTRNKMLEALEYDTVTGKKGFEEYKFELAPDVTEGTDQNTEANNISDPQNEEQ